VGAEEKFARAHNGSRPRCDFGQDWSDCAELAKLEPTHARRVVWLERGCTHWDGDLCVELVGTFDYPEHAVDGTRAIDLLRKGCEGPKPGRSCAELVHRLTPSPWGAFDAPRFAEVVRYAERACFRGGGSVPMLGFGPSPCFWVARAYYDGVADRPKDAMRAGLLFEEACEQEIALGPPKAGASCFSAARVWLNQPPIGREAPDRAPLDANRAKAFLERGCANQQPDCCQALAGRGG
jgi:hypothetical protein